MGLLITIGFVGLCSGKPNPNNVEVMPSSGGLPPVQSGIPSGSNVEAMPANAGSMTRPNWPGSYPSGSGAPVYGNQYPSSGYSFKPSGGSYQPQHSSGGCSSGGCSSGSSYPAPQPSYGGSGYNPGWNGG